MRSRVGIMPTPAVPRIVDAIVAAGGVMISASHNPVEDNGIKFFGADGYKLDDAREREIEALLDDDAAIPRPTHERVGMVRTSYGLVDRYFAALLEAGSDLSGLTVVVDAAYGAAYLVGPRALAKLGATVVAMHAEDDGSQINVACGATHYGGAARARARTPRGGCERARGRRRVRRRCGSRALRRRKRRDAYRATT